MPDEFPDLLIPPGPDWETTDGLYDGHGTGAVLLTPDDRDFHMERIPEVARMLTLGAPLSFDLSQHVKGVNNQGATSACVAFSTAGLKSVQDQIQHTKWYTFDAAQLYRDNGGTGQNGVDTRRVLAYAQERGLSIVGTTQRSRIGSYAFPPQDPASWVATLKAAVAAGQPCVVATLLPSQFGWDSSGGTTQAYHQMCLTGYDEQQAVFLNSWGAGWGRNGFGRLRWDYLTGGGFQGRYCYAYSVTDLLDDGLGGDTTPPPPPPPNDKAAAVALLVNQARVGAGLQALTIDPVLTQVAAAHSSNMATANFYSHNSPDGKTPRDRLTAAGVGANVAWAENIAAGVSDPNSAHAMWMNSPPHRANIMNPQMTSLGVGFAEGAAARYRYYWTEVFTGGGNVTPPPVDRLSIILVQGDGRDVLVSQGGPITVTGTGFASGQVLASIAGVSCIVEPRSATSLVVRAPLSAVAGELRLSRGTDQVVGPRIVVA